MNKDSTHIIRNLPFAEYQARPGINSSSLGDIDPKRRDAGSPAKYHHNHVLGNAEPFDSDPLRFGRAFHSFCLTPDTFSTEYEVESERLYRSILDKANAEQKAAKRKPSATFSKSLGAWKAFKEQIEASGKELLSADSMHQIESMASHKALEIFKSNMRRPQDMETEISIFSELLTNSSHPEHDAVQGMNCKARLDAYDPGTNTIYDLKTISEWNPGGSVAQWAWHRQAAFYTDLAVESGLAEPGCKFIWVFVKKSPPYEALAHTVELEILGEGRRSYRNLLTKIHECRTNCEWPGPGITYPYGLQTILNDE